MDLHYRRLAFAWLLGALIACDGDERASGPDTGGDSTEADDTGDDEASAEDTGGDTDGNSTGSDDGGDDEAEEGDWDDQPCEEGRTALVVLTPEGQELWRNESQEESATRALVSWDDGSWLRMLLTGGTSGQRSFEVISAEGQLVSNTIVSTPLAGADGQSFRVMRGLGGFLLTGGTSHYVRGGDATGYHAARIDRFDQSFHWQDGFDVADAVIDGDAGLVGLEPDGAGGVYLHGGACEKPCGAWLERRSGTLALQWRVEWEGDVGSIGTRSDGSVVIAVQDIADAEALGARLMVYSPDGGQLWSRPYIGKIEALGITNDDSIVVALWTITSVNGSLDSQRGFALHDDSGEIWARPRDFSIAKISAHQTNGFVVAGWEGVTAYHADGTVNWEFIDQGDPRLHFNDMAVGPTGAIAVSGSRTVSCEPRPFSSPRGEIRAPKSRG